MRDNAVAQLFSLCVCMSLTVLTVGLLGKCSIIESSPKMRLHKRHRPHELLYGVCALSVVIILAICLLLVLLGVYRFTRADATRREQRPRYSDVNR